MADKKFTDLTSKTTAAATDVVAIVDVSTSSSKKTTVAGLATAVGASIPDGSLLPKQLVTGTGSSWVWTNFTPTWAGSTAPSLGNGVLTARYTQVGKTVFLNVNYLFGSTTTYGTGEWNWTLPVAPLTTQGYFFGSAWALDAGLNYYGGVSKVTTSSARINIHSSAATGTGWGTTSPFTFGNGDSLGFSIVYEAA